MKDGSLVESVRTPISDGPLAPKAAAEAARAPARSATRERSLRGGGEEGGFLEG